MFLTCFMHAQVFTSVGKAERKVSRIKQVVRGEGGGGGLSSSIIMIHILSAVDMFVE